MRVFRHDRDRGERRDARLADRHEVRTRPHDAEKVDDVTDIFVQTEPAGGERHLARVVPVGDVDVVVDQHRLHGVAQERGEVARHRRDDQHARSRVRHVLPEPQQRSERRRMDGFLVDRDVDFAHLDAVDAKRRPAMGQRREQEHFACRRDLAQRAVTGKRGPRSIQYREWPPWRARADSTFRRRALDTIDRSCCLLASSHAFGVSLGELRATRVLPTAYRLARRLQ